MGIQLFDLTPKCWLHRDTERQCLPDPGDWGHVGLSGLRYWPEGLLPSLLKQLWYCLCTEQENIYAMEKFHRGSAEDCDVPSLWLPLPQLITGSDSNFLAQQTMVLSVWNAICNKNTSAICSIHYINLRHFMQESPDPLSSHYCCKSECPRSSPTPLM